MIGLSILAPAPVASGDLSDWYESLRRISPSSGVMLSCCADHDAVYADHWTVTKNGALRATITGGGPRNHPWAPVGRTYNIPDHMIVKGGANPTGHTMMFLKPSSLEPICFVFGDGV